MSADWAETNGWRPWTRDERRYARVLAREVLRLAKAERHCDHSPARLPIDGHAYHRRTKARRRRNR